MATPMFFEQFFGGQKSRKKKCRKKHPLQLWRKETSPFWCFQQVVNPRATLRFGIWHIPFSKCCCSKHVLCFLFPTEICEMFVSNIALTIAHMFVFEMSCSTIDNVNITNEHVFLMRCFTLERNQVIFVCFKKCFTEKQRRKAKKAKRNWKQRRFGALQKLSMSFCSWIPMGHCIKKDARWTYGILMI